MLESLLLHDAKASAGTVGLLRGRAGHDHTLASVDASGWLAASWKVSEGCFARRSKFCAQKRCTSWNNHRLRHRKCRSLPGVNANCTSQSDMYLDSLVTLSPFA